MKGVVLALACLLLIGSAVADKKVDYRKITSADVQAALTEFMNNVRAELNALSQGGSSSRRRLQSWTPGQNIHEFFEDILGSKWADYLPSSWNTSAFSWKKLGDFGYESNLQDFLSDTSLSSLAKPQSLAELHANLDKLESDFCTAQSFDPGHLEDSSCSGPSVTLAFVPKKCVINEVAKQIVCTPAKLVLTKLPGSCTYKHWSPATWTGKTCALKGAIGVSSEVVVGARSYNIPLPSLFSKGDDDTAPAPGPAA